MLWLGSTCFNAKERAGEKISLFDLAKISVKLQMQSVLKSKKGAINEAVNCSLQKLKITESTLPIEMSILPQIYQLSSFGDISTNS